MKTLDLCSFPLEALALIEASAGTGKTYAVANLYLRYLLEQKLGVDEILVVTFTEAATQELRDRIRARIQELIQVFNGAPSDDQVLGHLYRHSTDLAADKLRLRIAERQMDQAEIHTIHGFCQQLLSRHALDLNVALTQNLVEDTKPLLLQVCEDFWRQKVLTLPKEQVLEVYQYWSTPESLMLSLTPLIHRRPERCSPQLEEGGLDVWQERYQESISWYHELKQKTLAHIDELEAVIAASKLKGLKHKLNWLAAIRHWCESEYLSFDLPKTSSRKNLFAVFTPGGLSQETKKGCEAPQHEYFTFLEAHLDAQPVSLKHVFLVQAFQEIKEAFNREKASQGAVSFDDLILSVAAAIANDHTRDTLINVVRERFSAALIDEFQDTDREQYQIFSSIFASSLEGKKDASMVLIGDPKQAIYAFRGGDIATYLRAKQDISEHQRGELFTMDTNWRSSPEMVSAVNQVFQQQEQPFMAKAIPFYPVNAAKDSREELKNSAALNISVVRNDGRKKEALSAILADNMAKQILSLLASDSVQYADIAVLVRSGNEAELVKNTLSSYGLGASYEGKHNIYESAEACSLYNLLAALAEPGDEYLLMRCLSDLFFGVDDSRLYDLQNRAGVLEHYLDIFSELHRVWLRHGVLAAIRASLSRLDVYQSWHQEGLDNIDWERRLSNINQLAELLQNQSEKTRGHFALLRWLQKNIRASALADDESRLRLENDEQLIRIVTIHKSKGLEYPYVFLPFLFSARGADMAWFYDDAGKLNLDLLKDEANLSVVDRERLAEDIRLLYVALTRAKYQCFLGTFFYKGAGQLSLGVAKTAWAYLLPGESALANMDEELYCTALQRLADLSNNMIAYELIDEDALKNDLQRFSVAVQKLKPRVLQDGAEQAGVLSPAELGRSLSNSWKIQSFTALMQENHAQPSSHGLVSNKPLQAERVPTQTSVSDGLSILDFPRGSKAGTFLHTLFENVEFETAQPLDQVNAKGEPVSLRDMIHDKLSLANLVEDETLEQWSEYLSHWLAHVLAFELQPGFSLSTLALSAFQAEMEFCFKVERCQAAEFNHLLSKYDSAVPSLDFSSFEGHLKGAIDLVFEHKGRYFLLDYKSNYLGATIGDYSEENMAEAMLDHRYDLQYLIYSVALHRYLKFSLGAAYSYERDFGGVYYLFLRGLPHNPEMSDLAYLGHELSNSAQPGVFFLKPASDLIFALDQYLEGA